MKNNVAIVVITVSVLTAAMLGCMALYVSAEKTLPGPTAIPSIPAVPQVPGQVPQFPKFPTIFPGPSATPSPTPAPTLTPTPVPSVTPVPTALPTVTPAPTAVPIPTASPEVTIPSPTVIPQAQDSLATTRADTEYTCTATPSPMMNVTQIPIISINKELRTENPWLLLALLIGLVAIVVGVRTTYRKK